MGGSQNGLAPADELLLARRELAVQRQDEINEAGGQVPLRTGVLRHAVDARVWHNVSLSVVGCAPNESASASALARRRMLVRYIELPFDIEDYKAWPFRASRRKCRLFDMTNRNSICRPGV